MGTGTSDRNIKAITPARCSICRKIPQSDCDWRQERCPYRQPSMVEAAIRNFFNFFKTWR
jgi:hypothetical protein